MAARLEHLRDMVLVQCARTETERVMELAERPGAGVVVTGPVERRTVRALADTAYRKGVPLLLDAARYAGSARDAATAPFDSQWLALQRDTGLAVLTDSGYIGEQDVAGLESVLNRAAALGDVIATLPLHAGWWFDRQGGLPVLLDRVGVAGVPVALVLEHRDDPFGVGRTVRGVLDLVSVGVPLVLLRSDVSGLGLLCHGAFAAAVGTRTSLRHLYPIASSTGGFRPAAVATLVADLLSFHSVDRIAAAIAAEPDSLMWRDCTCSTCNGRQLDRIAMSPDPEKRERAFGHALNVLFDLRDQLLSQTTDVTDRQRSWRAQCDSAGFRFEELNDDVQRLTAPAFLRNWRAVPVRAATG